LKNRRGGKHGQLPLIGDVPFERRFQSSIRIQIVSASSSSGLISPMRSGRVLNSSASVIADSLFLALAGVLKVAPSKMVDRGVNGGRARRPVQAVRISPLDFSDRGVSLRPRGAAWLIPVPPSSEPNRTRQIRLLRDKRVVKIQFGELRKASQIRERIFEFCPDRLESLK
jgi:hypothetical protein